MKLIGLACAVGVLVSGGCAENLTAPPPAGPDHIVIRGPSSVMVRPALIIVDGRILEDNGEIQRIDPAQIRDIEVVKGAAAVERFGSRGAHGVILITLKHAG